MPSYYFHLAFELYRQSLDTTNQNPPCTTSLATNSPSTIQDVATTDLYQSAGIVEESYHHPCNLDIFDAVLPAHRASSWASRIAPKREYKRGVEDLSRSRESSRVGRSLRAARKPDIGEDALTAGQEEEDSQTETEDCGERTLDSKCCDWRLGKISVESIDIEQVRSAGDDMEAQEQKKNHDLNGTGASGDVALRGKYIPSNPRTTEFGWGVVHLYRDAQESPELGGGIASYSTGASSKNAVEVSEDVAFVDKECTTLCILAVPSYMTPSDLLGWLGDETREVVSHFRLVRTGRSNKFMVLIKFRDAKITKNWQNEWNGKLFNSMEVCA